MIMLYYENISVFQLHNFKITFIYLIIYNTIIYICTVPGCLSVMGHSFTVTSDTDILIWRNESHVFI